jgi:hypothetical protein
MAAPAIASPAWAPARSRARDRPALAGRSRGPTRWSGSSRRPRLAAPQTAAQGADDLHVRTTPRDGPPNTKTLVAVLCGGPSQERGISLNSARSVLDHLRSEEIDVECFYFDRALRAYAVATKEMYSNTPSDFDFKLRNGSKSKNMTLNKTFQNPDELAAHLSERNAIAFPAVHGAFGEDGTLQLVLEKHR